MRRHGPRAGSPSVGIHLPRTMRAVQGFARLCRRMPHGAMMSAIMSSLRRMRAVSWIAVLALLASVLVPSASRAIAAWSGSGSPWDEICTSLGIKKAGAPLAEGGSQAPAVPSGQGSATDCPYCMPSANPVGVPVRPSGVPPAAQPDTSPFLFFFISAPHPAPAPGTSQPRAPPHFA